MRSDYRLAPGHGNAFGVLALIVPQPRSESRVQAAQREYGVDATLYQAGPFIRLQWSSLEIEDYPALLEQFDLNTFLSTAVTLWCPDHNGIYKLYDGIATRPVNPERQIFLQNITLIVSRLVLTG